MIAALALAAALLLVYALWGLFLAVMALKHARNAGRLTPWAWRFGLPILMLGYLLDFFVNMVVMTVLLCEIPREWLVTARVKRLLADSGYRGAVARWLDTQLLDPIDPGHCK